MTVAQFLVWLAGQRDLLAEKGLELYDLPIGFIDIGETPELDMTYIDGAANPQVVIVDRDDMDQRWSVL